MVNSSVKINFENFKKMYYNLLRVINGKQAGLPRHLSQLKNNLEKYIFVN
jgi:hypothetical protein